jgi:hypothetical protein
MRPFARLCRCDGASSSRWIPLACLLGTTAIGGSARGQTPGSPVPCIAPMGTEELAEFGKQVRRGSEEGYRVPPDRWTDWVIQRHPQYPSEYIARSLDHPDDRNGEFSVSWPSEMGWGDSSPPLFVLVGHSFPHFVFGAGRSGFEVHTYFKGPAEPARSLVDDPGERKLVRFLEVRSTGISPVERDTAIEFLRSVRIGFDTGRLPWRRDGAIRLALDERTYWFLPGECLSLDWRGHAAEIAVGDLDAVKPDPIAWLETYQWAHVSIRVKWPSGVPFRRWRPK